LTADEIERDALTLGRDVGLRRNAKHACGQVGGRTGANRHVAQVILAFGDIFLRIGTVKVDAIALIFVFIYKSTTSAKFFYPFLV
jgi:hypothetical protein